MSNYFSLSMALFISVVVFAALLPSPASSSSLAATVTGYEGEFFVDLFIGTPPKNYSLVLDTDSSLVWAANYSKTSTSFSTLACTNNLCTKAKGSCDKSCHYGYTSTNRTKFSVGLATETFIFNNDVVPQLAFANAAVESNVTGGLGLGRGPLSLVSQMMARKFSYCLPDYDYPDKKGFLYIGSLAKSHPEMINTSLVIKNSPTIPSTYYVKVQGMSVNNVRLPIDKSAFEISKSGSSTGGFIIDTGSTMTYLNKKIFYPLQNELKNQIPFKPTRITDNLDLPLLCYDVPTNFALPRITLHFGPSSSLTLSVGNTFREYTDTTTNQNISCLAMAEAPSTDNGRSSLGNIQLQNTLVYMDLAKQTVGFRPNTECDTVK